MNSERPIRGKRLFVAVPVPEYVKEALSGLQERRRKGFHWVAPERFHLTLRFIGDLPGQLQEDIEKVLAEVRVAPFILPLEGVGRFPPKGPPHAVWAGVGGGHPLLFQLKKKIEDGLFQLGIEPEKRVYQPHLTVARVNHAAEETVRQFLKENQDFAATPFKVESFCLYQSDRSSGELQHIVERCFPLVLE
ncbi:MAG: RNA 2',3'-cyclic phosphodiesterase [Opitutales bacterium]|nr:RNA 2',3'-cyclic phosphodiesterase [Opitutales bacterium]